MATLDKNILNEFAKTVTAEQQKDDGVLVYGIVTRLTDDGAIVRLDGKTDNTLTPCAMGVSVTVGDRVTVNIGRNQAVIIANSTTSPDPTAQSKLVGGALAANKVITDYLNANYISADMIEANYVTTSYLTTNYLQTGQLDAQYASIAELIADYIKTTELTAEVAKLGYLKADSATITDLQADTAKIHNLTAEQLSAATGYVGTLTAGNVTANDIISDTAKVHNLTADQLSAATGYVGTLTAGNVTANDIISDTAKVHNLTADQLSAATGYIGTLTSNNVTANDIVSGHATIGSLDSNYAQIDLANVNNAWIQNGVVKDAAISDAQIIGVSANKLTAGTIDASNITVTNLNASNITTGTINGQRIGTGSLSLDKLAEDVYTEDEVDSMLSTMQAEIDGAIETFTGSVVPTLNNYPANAWSDNDAKSKHVGDVYYVVNAGQQADGYCYRFAYDNTTGTYGWVLIKDSDVTAALQRLIDAEGDIDDLETFQSTTTSWITNTDEELRSIKTNHTTLVTRVDKTLVSTTQLWFTKANTTAPNKPTAHVTSTSTSGNAWTTVVPVYDANYPNYFYCYEWRYSDGSYGWSAVTRDIGMGETQSTARTANTNASTAITNAATAQSTANNAATAASNAQSTANGAAMAASTAQSTADTAITNAATADSKAVAAQNTANANIKSTVQLWFIKANTTKPNKPTAHVTTNNASTANAWNLAVPTYNASYPYYYYCYEYQKGDGTYSWSDVVYDSATTENEKNSHDALTAVSTKVETSTFNELSQTVDSNTATITSLSSRVDTKADGSTVTTLSNTVNSVQQTANSNSSKISNLTTVLGTNADGTTSANDIIHKVSEIDQDLDSITTRVGKTETWQNNFQVGGRNLLIKNDWYTEGNYANSRVTKTGPTEDSTTLSGYSFKFTTVTDATENTKHVYLTNMKSRGGMVDGEEYIASFWIRASKDTNIQPNAHIECYKTAQTKIENPVITTKWQRCSNKFIFNASAQYQAWYLLYPNALSGFTTGDYIEICDLKLERGNIATAWTPAPEDIEVRVTATETSITQNAEAIALRATKTEVTNAINNIEIGGRNLVGRTYDYSGKSYDEAGSIDIYANDAIAGYTYEILDDTNFKTKVFHATITSEYTFSTYRDSLVKNNMIKLEPDTDYILSYYAKGTGIIHNYLYPDAIANTTTSWGYNGTSSDGYARNQLTSNWEKYWVKWHTLSTVDTTAYKSFIVARIFKPSSGSSDFYIAEMKLEKGNVATDWTPAPEDIEVRVTAAETSITQNAEQIALRATKTEVTNAIDAIDVGGRNLLRLSNSSESNQLETFSGGAVASTNTVVTEDMYTCYKSTGNATSVRIYGGGIGAINAYAPRLDADTTYIYSAWIKVTTTTSTTSVIFNHGSLGHFQVINANSSASDKTHEDIVSKRIYYPSQINMGEWTKINITFTTNTLDGSYFGVYPKYNLGTDYILYIRDMKLEKGNIATDWTPAPEDMASQADLSSVETGLSSDIADVSAIVTSHSSSIEELSDSIESVVEYTETLQGDNGIIKQMQSDIKQNADNVTIALSYQNTIDSIQTTFTFAQDGLEINKSNSNIYSKQGANYYKFIDKEKATDVFEINEKGTTGLHSNVTGQIGIGAGSVDTYTEQWAIRKGAGNDTDGYNLDFVWVGGN